MSEKVEMVVEAGKKEWGVNEQVDWQLYDLQ